MKRTFLIAFLFSISLASISQQTKYFSIEANINYYYYLFPGQGKNKFNYGGSLIGSLYLNRFKIGTGIDYSTKFSFFTVSPENANNYLTRKDYSAYYVSVPIRADFIFLSKKTWQASAGTGILLGWLFKYDVVTRYEDGFVREENLLENQQIDLSLTLGVTYAHLIGTNLKLSISPFSSYLLNQQEESGPSSPDYPPDGRLCFGLKIGIEYLFRREKRYE